jgi:hypothetical protein
MKKYKKSSHNCSVEECLTVALFVEIAKDLLACV